MKLRLTRLNITQKLMGYLTALSIIPLLIVGLTSSYLSSILLQQEAQLYTLELVANQKDYLELQLAQVESLLANISGVEEIRNALDDRNIAANTYTSLATHARIGYILNGYTNLKGLVSIDIFTVGGAHYHVGDTLNVKNIRTGIRDAIFAQTLNSDQRVLWVGIEDNVNANSTYPKVITAARLLKKISPQTLQQEPVALFLVNLSVEDVYNHFNRIDLGSRAYLVVVDAEQRIIYHPDKTLLGSRLNPAVMQKLTADRGTLVDTIDGERVSISYHHSNMSGWTVMSFIPLKTLSAKASVIQVTTLAVLLLCFGVVTFFAFQYNRDVVQPIREITHRFQLLQTNTLNPQTRLTTHSTDEIGELIRWFNTFMDSLAAKEQSEKALRESEERYALAVRGANDGLWDWDLKNNRLYLSPRWKAMLGVGEGELAQSPHEWLDRIHPQDSETVDQKIKDHLAGLAPHFEVEHRLRHSDGHYRWMLARGLAVFGPDGTPYRMVGSHTDITERKRAEEELKESLQEKVVLLQEIHHRVKNNLQIVSSLFNLQTQGVQDQALLDLLSEGQNRIRSMALIHEMLYRTRNLARIDFAEYIRTLTPYLYRSYSRAGRNIDITIESDQVFLSIDTAVPCGLILNELVSNSLKHAFPDGRAGRITIACRHAPPQNFTLTVADTGIGIPQDFAVESATSLGLQLVVTLVNQLDGHLQITSLHGTCAVITIPIN